MMMMTMMMMGMMMMMAVIRDSRAPSMATNPSKGKLGIMMI